MFFLARSARAELRRVSHGQTCFSVGLFFFLLKRGVRFKGKHTEKEVMFGLLYFDTHLADGVKK